MRNRRLLTGAGTVFALALVLAACGTDEGTTDGAACTAERLKTGGSALGAPDISGAELVAGVNLAQAKKTVKVGMFGDLTGGNSALVIPVRNGIQLAFEQANAAGKLKVDIEFVPKDNKDASPDTAPAIEQGFIQDKDVIAVIGGTFSGETLAVGRLFDAAGLTHLSASATNPTITQNGWPFFRLLNTDAVQGAAAAELLQALGCTKVAVVNDKGDYGKGLADFVTKKLKELGIEVVVEEGVAAKTTDYGPLVDTLQAKGPQAVFYGGYYNDGSLILKQMRERGLNATFLCGDGCTDQQLVTLAGAANANGAILTCPCLLAPFSTDAAAVQFVTDYKAKFGVDPAIYAAEGYDAANILVQAIDASDDDGTVTREEIFTFVDGLTGYKGLAKTYEFDQTGELSAAASAILVYQVKDGKLGLVGDSDGAA